MEEKEPPKKKRKKRAPSEAELGVFLRKYGRKASHNSDPNDRGYSRDIEEKIKRMSPEELDRLMRGEDK